MKHFYRKIGGKRNVEISNLKRVIPGDPEKIVKYFHKRDLYILGGEKENTQKRAGNDDIKSKCYFFFDFDIRKDYKEIHEKVLSQEELNKEIVILKNILDSDQYLKEWSYIINSGNGAHVYYCGKTLIVGEDITAKEYSNGVKKIFEVFIQHIKNQYKEYQHFIPDIACSNIARTSRAPLSINHKKKHGMGDLKVEILFSQDIESRLIEKLPQLGKEQKYSTKKKIYKNRKKENNTSTYKEINVGRFSIGEVVKHYTGQNAINDNISCPFPDHDDKNPSFRAYTDTNICKCFGCGRGGNPANFLKHLKGISYGEALKELDKNF